MIDLPLRGIQSILASDKSVFLSEDFVYDLVLEWVEKHYSESDKEKRQEILDSQLSPYIRFPHMTSRRLKKMLTSDDLKPSDASQIVFEALFFKTERCVQPNSSNSQFVERPYEDRPIKIVKFEVPLPQCIVYLDLKRDECERMCSTLCVRSQEFSLREQRFKLIANCGMYYDKKLLDCFGLFLRRQEEELKSMTINLEFSARSKPTEEFARKLKESALYTKGKRYVGMKNLFAIPWETFIAKDSPYFINDILHLRVDLSICP